MEMLTTLEILGVKPEYTFHEAANLFPMLHLLELEELANDIICHGLLHPIVLHEGQILDGRNRYFACLLPACKQAGVEPRFVEWEPNGISPLNWVVSQNIYRRHLSASQRACLAVEIKPQIAAEAKKNQKLVATPRPLTKLTNLVSLPIPSTPASG